MFDPQNKIYLSDCFARETITLCFCLKFATTERAGILHDPWIRSFVSASENLKRLGVQCYAEQYKFAGAVARRDNYDHLL